MSVDRDYLETLTKRIDALELEVKKLRNNIAPTVPVYDSTNYPADAVEGQVAIVDA